MALGLALLLVSATASGCVAVPTGGDGAEVVVQNDRNETTRVTVRVQDPDGTVVVEKVVSVPPNATSRFEVPYGPNHTLHYRIADPSGNVDDDWIYHPCSVNGTCRITVPPTPRL